jgi:hypothetical protein
LPWRDAALFVPRSEDFSRVRLRSRVAAAFFAGSLSISLGLGHGCAPLVARSVTLCLLEITQV